MLCKTVDWHFKLHGSNGTIDPDVLLLRKGIVQATLDTFRAATVNLLPTPAKSHYTFNLRDMSRVIQVSSYITIYIYNAAYMK
jgi:dynein heavy chain, axonemal